MLTSFGFGPTAAASWEDNRTASLLVFPNLSVLPGLFPSPERIASSPLYPIPPADPGSRMDAAGGVEAAANGGIEGSADPCSSGGAGGYRRSVHQIAGGGKGLLLSCPNSPLPGLRIAIGSAPCCHVRAIISADWLVTSLRRCSFGLLDQISAVLVPAVVD